MKIATLNVGRRTAPEKVEPITEYLEALNVDTVVITEFRLNLRRPVFLTRLPEMGYSHFAATTDQPKVSSVAIFSKHPFTSESFPELGRDAKRLLKAYFDGFELYGGYFPLDTEKKVMWEFILERRHRPTHEKVFLIGDLNNGITELDSQSTKFTYPELFTRMEEIAMVDSWRSRNPDTLEYSHYSNAGNGFRLDHLFSSPAADARISSIYYDHHPRTAKLTDHSALIVELAV